jgi:hypothetical protein
MEITFHLTEESINGLAWEEYEVFERVQDGEAIKLYRLRPVLARFMVDDNKQPLKHADAMKLLAKVEVKQIAEVVTSFIEGLTNSTVPKVSGDSLNSPSEAAPLVSESPAGSE